MTVSTANHKYATGEYKIHVYLTAGNNIQKVVVAPSQTGTLICFTPESDLISLIITSNVPSFT